MHLRIFTLSPKKVLIESYNSGVVTYDPDRQPPTGPAVAEEIVLPLAPFVQERADRSRKSLSISIEGDVIGSWCKALFEQEVDNWKRGIR